MSTKEKVVSQNNNAIELLVGATYKVRHHKVCHILCSMSTDFFFKELFYSKWRFGSHGKKLESNVYCKMITQRWNISYFMLSWLLFKVLIFGYLVMKTTKAKISFKNWSSRNIMSSTFSIFFQSFGTFPIFYTKIKLCIKKMYFSYSKFIKIYDFLELQPLNSNSYACYFLLLLFFTTLIFLVPKQLKIKKFPPVK